MRQKKSYLASNLVKVTRSCEVNARWKMNDKEKRWQKILYKCEAETKERRANGKSDKKCGGCVRCEKAEHRKNSTGWHCCGMPYDVGILPSDRACGEYWDREEQEKIDREKAEQDERERMARWEQNKNNPPVKLPIVFDGYGTIPMCPVCHEMPYSTEQCYFCGQRFIQDKEIEEYNKPLTKECVCINCGTPGLMHISKYNGHKSFRCEKCGIAWME